jgi:hypothetical protein
MLILLVATTKILADKAGKSIDQARLPCRPFCLVLCLLKAFLLKWIFVNLYGLIDGLHWGSLLAKLSATATRDSQYCTCLGHLGRCNTYRIVFIFCHATQGGQGKYKCVTVMCYCCRRYRTNLCQCKYGLSNLLFLDTTISQTI